MKGYVRLCAVVVALGICASAWAMPASELKNLAVTEHIFSTQVLTVNGFLRTDDPDTLRFLVIRLDATRANDDQTQIFGHDFVFSYTVPGDDGPVEQRAGVEAISVPGDPWDFGYFVGGVEPRVPVEGTQISIGLVAFIENEVTSVKLLRAGTADAINIDLTKDIPRKLSVYVLTSQGQDVGNNVLGVLRNQGLDAHLSLGLNADMEGCEVLYGKFAETAARSAAAALKQAIGRDFTVTELDENTVMCEYDILVRIGKAGGGGVTPNPL